MADKYPSANGNWSTAANWNGGTLPGAGDTVYADGKTIAIDQDITVVSINTTQRSGGTAGGSFTCNTARSITANIIAGTTSCLVLSHTSGNTVTITGNTTGGGSVNARGISNTSTGDVVISGTSTGGTSTFCHGVDNISTGTCTISGVVTGGSGIAAYGANNQSTGTIVPQSNIAGGSVSAGINNNTGGTITGSAVKYYNTGATASITNNTGTVSLTGDFKDHTSIQPFVSLTGNGTVNIIATEITANAILTATGIVYSSAGGTINITCPLITGGTQLTAYAIVQNGTGACYITGSHTSGAGATAAPALYSASNCTWDVSADTTADGTSAIVSTGQTATNILRGAITNNGNILAFCCRNITISAAPSVIAFGLKDTGGTVRALSTDNAIAGQPVEANVRIGVQYGLLNERTGTAYCTAEDFIAALKADDLGKRLKVCSTVEITGEQIKTLT